MQCDVHRNPDTAQDHAPFLLDVQTDLLAELDTRVVVPLVRASAFGRRANRLHPEFIVDGEHVVMATHLLAAIRRTGLGMHVVSLSTERATIISAVDVLLSGV